jgi:Putative addiction module component
MARVVIRRPSPSRHASAAPGASACSSVWTIMRSIAISWRANAASISVAAFCPSPNVQSRSSLSDRSRAFKPSLSPANLLFMNERIKKLTEQASSLPPIERAELVEGILQTLDAADPNLDQVWVEEAKDPLAAYRRGEIEALDFDETLAKHASRP